MNGYLFFLILQFGAFVFPIDADFCPEIARHGTNYTFVTEVESPRITWKYNDLDKQSVDKNALTCWVSSIDPNCSGTSRRFRGSIVSKLNGKYKATLTIGQVDRDKDATVWTWLYDSSPLGSCLLNVYVPIPQPECNDIQFTQDGLMLWTCNVYMIYPEVECQVEYKETNQDYSMLPASISTRTGELIGTPGYYDYVTCRITLSPGHLSLDTEYQFQIYMYYSNMMNMFNTTQSEQVTLRLPQVELRDCPSGDKVKDGYIKAGTRGYCVCSLKEAGYPRGKAVWQVGNSSGPLINFTLYENMAPPTVYTCIAQNSLRVGNMVTFTPKVAYGPTDILMTMMGINISTLHKCKTNTRFITYCDVIKASVSPKPMVYLITGQNNSFEPIGEMEMGDYYRYSFQIVPSHAGNISITCVAYNTKFTEIQAERERWINVLEPPQQPPVITINGRTILPNEKIVLLTAGDEVEVKCHVIGGYPAVLEVTTSCVGQILDQNQMLHVNKSMDMKTCVCHATHVTECYSKTTEVTLKVFSQDDSNIPNTSSDSLDVPTVVGIVISVFVLACLCFVIGMKVEKRRREKKRGKEGETTPMPVIRQASVPLPELDTYDVLELPVRYNYDNDKHQAMSHYESVITKQDNYSPTYNSDNSINDSPTYNSDNSINDTQTQQLDKTKPEPIYSYPTDYYHTLEDGEVYDTASYSTGEP